MEISLNDCQNRVQDVVFTHDRVSEDDDPGRVEQSLTAMTVPWITHNQEGEMIAQGHYLTWPCSHLISFYLKF